MTQTFRAMQLSEQAYKEHTVYRYHTQTWYDGGCGQAIWYYDAGKGVSTLVSVNLIENDLTQ